MAVSSLDIRRQEFSKRFLSFNGYAPHDVHDYLETLAKEIDIYNEKLRAAYEQIQRLKADLEHYQKVEEALQEALETARENARKTQQNAEQKAALIVRDAEARSARMIEESSMQAQKIVHEAEVMKAHARQEVVRLNERRNELTLRLKGFLTAETELLSRIDQDYFNYLTSNDGLSQAFVDRTTGALSDHDVSMVIPSEFPPETHPFANSSPSAPETDDVDAVIPPPIENSGDEALPDVMRMIPELSEPVDSGTPEIAPMTPAPIPPKTEEVISAALPETVVPVTVPPGLPTPEPVLNFDPAPSPKAPAVAPEPVAMPEALDPMLADWIASNAGSVAAPATTSMPVMESVSGMPSRAAQSAFPTPSRDLLTSTLSEAEKIQRILDELQ